ncbi:hypothetical protein FO519_006038 [Halicephalobus sp. NKZ332]|nr:hypothetical protein FO519_006038 [Halicephalobus sp. NKZ332]
MGSIKRRRLLAVLSLFLLFNFGVSNPFEEDEEVHGKLETHHQHDDQKNKGFHAKVDAEEDDNGFSYKVDTNVDSDGEEKSQNIRIQSTPYGASRDPSLSAKNDDRQVITGIPDLSDPCFRRYANSIIVNAQPYERRSSISLTNCKVQCLQSQIGVYSCRSFVYDNVNQVCDLFAHVGDQAPARLLRFKTRDYFEPTAAISCNADAALLNSRSNTTSKTTVWKEQDHPGSSFNLENSIVSSPTSLPPLAASSCETGKSARFLKTQGFELHTFDDVVVEGISLDECINFCSSNIAANGSTLKCNSFEYSETKCVLSTETAVPLGNGQLKQQQGTDYFEKVCVDEKLARECPSIYNRFPQMILVGFAETVVDATSLQQCFDNCLNSKKLYGFKCISGMYYFEEPQLNCILNTEDRFTQPDLFTSESSDLVDYFETGCNGSVGGSVRRFASSSGTDFEAKKQDFVAEQDGVDLGWTEWSSCLGGTNLQQRTKICAQGKICGHDSRPCDNPAEESSVRRAPQRRRKLSELSKEQILSAWKHAKCPPDTCCPIFGGCQIGMIQYPASRKIEWCYDPCPKKRAARVA